MGKTKSNFFENVLRDNDLCLAPLAGVTDAAFRRICLESGAGLMFTEMISAKGLFYSNKATETLLYKDKYENLTGVQIFGSDVLSIQEAVSRHLNNAGFAFIDINFGCPVRKIVSNGDGSALMKKPEQAAKIAKCVVDSSKLPVSAKIRLGTDSNSINCVEISLALEEAGVDLITVHGRTAEQMYSGKADWHMIKKVSENVRVPVIANGDVKDYDSYMKIKETTGCAGVMIGRAALGNPFVFSEIIAKNKGLCYNPPSVAERMNTALRHLKLLVEYKTESVALKEFRKHLAWYTKGMYNSAKLRGKINTANSISDYEALIDQIVQDNA